MTEKQTTFLNNLKPEPLFISNEAVEQIEAVLETSHKTVGELKQLRNKVVKYFNSKPLDEHGRMFFDDNTRLSMIVAVIDHSIWLKCGIV